MAQWSEPPDPCAGDDAAYVEAWEGRLLDELEAEAGDSDAAADELEELEP